MVKNLVNCFALYSKALKRKILNNRSEKHTLKFSQYKNERHQDFSRHSLRVPRLNSNPVFGVFYINLFCMASSPGTLFIAVFKAIIRMC